MHRLAPIAAFLACVGCAPMYFTHFAHPIVDEGGARVDPALVGRWMVDEDGPEKVVVEISPNGDVRAFAESSEAGESRREDRFQLVTATIGNLSVASVRSGIEADETWIYFHYWFPEPGVVRYAQDETRFWRDAVRNRMVAGTIGVDVAGNSTTTVTASGGELRAFVLGYGSVIFTDTDDDPGRLRRVPGGS